MIRVGCLIFSSFIFLLCSAQTKLWVAPDGSDKNAGTFSKPFSSIEKALSRIAGSSNTKVEILLRAGTYSPTNSIQITPSLLNKHSLLIAAYKNEKVCITGAVKINPQWQEYKDEILQADIGKGLLFDQLFCNGKAMAMARYPNYDSNARVFNGTAADAISPQRIKTWADPTGGYVHALHNGEWGDFHYRINAKNADTLVLEGGWQNNRPAPMHKEYRFVENIFEELDAAGEWFYNYNTGILYFFPPKSLNINDALFERSVLEDIIRIKGSEENPVQRVHINGILFAGTARTFMQIKEPLLRSDWTIQRGGAIVTEGAKDISISNCIFTQLGGNAIFVSRYNRNINCLHNYIHHIGANAFAFVGDTGAVRSPSFQYNQFVPIDKMDMTPGPKTNSYPSNCRVYDNLVHNIGTIEKQIAGVEIDIAMNITVSHNTIYNLPRAGINIGDGCFGGHIIEFNDVFNTVLETGDHGAFNSWGRDRFWLPGIAAVNKLVEQYPNLPLLDIIKPNVLRNNRFRCDHGWDIDLDDGSSNYLIYNNVCLNGGLKLREGFFRRVTNNIIINNTFHPHVWYAKSMDVFAHNIVTSAYAPIGISVWGKTVDSNFFIQPGALMAAQQNNTDKHSLAGNPYFSNAAAGNYWVPSHSAALRIGFINFATNEFGVVSPLLKQKAVKPVINPIRILETAKKGESMLWLGATIKNVETLGEQSASGLPDKNGVLITKVTAGSIAHKNGLEPRDVIRIIDGKEIINIADMLSTLQPVMWHGEVAATIWHNQQAKEMTMKLK